MREGLVRVLLVEDDEDDYVLIRDLLAEVRDQRFDVDWASRGEAAIELSERCDYDVCLMDYRLGTTSGLDLLRRFVGSAFPAPVIILTGQTDRKVDLEAMQAGAADYLIKGGIDAPLLERSIRYAIERKRDRDSLRHLQADLERQVQQRTEALRQNEQRWRKMAESLPQLVWTASPSGQCDYFSSQWTAFTGATPAELLGNRWLEYLHPDDRDRTLAAWQTAVKERGELDLEYRLRRSDGAYRWFKVRGLPIRDGDGPVLQWFGTSTDIDDQKRTEGALREADRRKDEFLATLAHELRNPLAPIRNALGILHLAPADGSAVRQARALIERQVAQMVRLVDDLLDVSRITRGKIELRKERVELADIVKAAVETSRPLIEAAGHQLRVVLPGEAIHLHADPTRLAQVLANLLNNSAKYMLPGGSILLSGAREGQWAIVRAKDTGIGIPPEMLDSIFDLFTQVDHSLERSQGGLGIGLTLVRSLVHLHGGTVEAVSEGRGRGSEFVVRLPAPTLATEVAPPLTGASEAPPPLAGRRVLLADDNRDGAESLAMLLRLTGHDVRVTFDGETAIAAARVFQPEVILLDIGMPKLNGYEVARRLRQGTDSAPVHLVAMTGWGQEEDRRRSREAGFDHHLVKPVDPAALQELLRTLAPASNGIAPASAADFFA